MKELVVEALAENLPEVIGFVDEQLEAVIGESGNTIVASSNSASGCSVFK